MNFWVHTAVMYRATAILSRVHAAFFCYHQFNEMTNTPDEVVLARIIIALDLEFERVLHNDYGLAGQVMRPVHVYSVWTTEASFNPADYKGAQYPISPFTKRGPRDELPFHQGVCKCLTFDETLPPEEDSDDEEYFPTGNLDDLVWSEEAVPNSQKHLCILQIPGPPTPLPQPDQVEVSPEPEQMDVDILDNLPDVINVPKELSSDFETWSHSLLEYQWLYDI